MGKKSNKVDKLSEELRDRLRYENAVAEVSRRAGNSNPPLSGLRIFFECQAARAMKRARKLESLLKGRKG